MGVQGASGVPRPPGLLQKLEVGVCPRRGRSGWLSRGAPGTKMRSKPGVRGGGSGEEALPLGGGVGEEQGAGSTGAG